jgi:signal transduction histidine kinase
MHLGRLAAVVLSVAALATLAALLWRGSTPRTDASGAVDTVSGIGLWGVAVAWLALAAVLAFVAGLAGATLARNRMAEALREARVERQSLAGLLDVWQWHTDLEHRLMRLVPPSSAPATAWSQGVGAQQPLWERFECAAAAPAALREYVLSQAPFVDLPVSHRDNGGAIHRWLLRGTPRFDAMGRFAGYLGTARPVEAVLESDAASQMPSPTSVPAVVAASATSSISDHEAFSYTVSHDLRAPIRVVEGFTRIVKEDYGRVLDKIGIDHLDRVLGAATRMNSMIDALLNLSQLSARPLASQPVNLSQLARYVVDDLRRHVPERSIDVHIEDGMSAQGDPTLLRIVLENLLGNAWKYSSKVGQARISFESAMHGGRPAFLVRDNGAGFDMRFADRLFGVFQRLHSASDFEGTGIGLASVQRIVRRHGGEIWAESEVNRGASFYFTLRA